MCQCVHTFTLILKIHQNKRMRPISPTTISSTAFTRRFIDVNPALPEPFCEDLTIGLAKRRQGSDNSISCLLVSYFVRCLLNNRSIKIIHMQLVEFKDTLTKPHITIQQ